MATGKRGLEGCGDRVSGVAQTVRTLKPAVVHHVPCRLHHDGPAPISGYFVVNEAPELRAESLPADAKLKRATLRGRRLLGAELDLAALGAHGLVIEERRVGAFGSKRQAAAALQQDGRDDGPGEEDDEVEGEDAQRQMRAEWDCLAHFDKINLWNYDRMPSDMDETRRWTEWLELADAIHG